MNIQWIRLAVDRINLCHRQADVENALQDMPSGMKAFYDRMAASVAGIPSATDKALADDILRTVACALRVLKIDELAELLDEEMSEMLDLERSVMELCGGFVVIDAGGNVAMVHQTAREYLLSGEITEHPFQIDRGEAHMQLFQNCMRSLTTTGLRGKLTRGNRPIFLDYATNMWAAHMCLTPSGCDRTLEILQKFFTGPWVLIWIHIAASIGRIRLLVQASRSLSGFSTRLSDQSYKVEDGQHMFQKELIDSWAVDLIKITGKFGSILRRNPEAIYKFIPPFCPRSSAIYQQFGKTESKTLQVSGSSTEIWDDAFARMAFGAYISSIAVAASSVAVLSSPGKILLYDSTTFDEMPASPIQHQERVYRMELNDSATLLATYGYRTVKVWQLPSGNCKLVIPNITSKPRPLAMRFLHNNRTLLIGTDDRKVRSIDLTADTADWAVTAELEEPELEGHFFNSANYMAFNRDGSLTAVAYRGHPLSAWETDGPTHIAHCWRKRDEIARGEVIEAIWHPHSPEVIGLYLEGVIFKSSPYDGATDEIATGASRLALSKNGNLVSTGDVHGRIKVYTVAGFGLLYQLASQDTVLGVAFSPNARRLYDIRGYYGNSWEPNCLAKFAEQSNREFDSLSESESLVQSSSAFENATLRVDRITALAASPLGRLYCYGSDKGTVSLCSTQEGKITDIHTSKGYFSIELITWSEKGDFLAFSDSSKKLFLVSVSFSTMNTSPITEKISDVSLAGLAKGPILQLMFSADSKRILVHVPSALYILSLPSFTVLRSMELEEDAVQCMMHPQKISQVLGIGLKAAYVFDWEISRVHAYRYDVVAGSLESTASVKVETAQLSADKRHILVHLISCTDHSQNRLLLSLSVLTIPATSSTDGPDSDLEDIQVAVETNFLSGDIASHINTPLSFTSDNRLIFISKDLAVCSWPFQPTPKVPSSRSAPIKNSAAGKLFTELFYLPGDWAGREISTISSVWKQEKTFMCPKNGEVVLVKCAGLK